MVLTIISNAASLILALVSIWLALYFYTQSKKTEAETSRALEGIKTQTEMLQRLAGNHMEMLIRGLVTPNPQQENIISMALTLVERVAVTPHLQAPVSGVEQGESLEPVERSALVKQIRTSHIGMYYYIAMTNLACQTLLPPEGQTNEAVQNTLDNSYVDFFYVDDLLSKVGEVDINDNPLAGLYQEASALKPLIKTSAMLYAERAA